MRRLCLLNVSLIAGALSFALGAGSANAQGCGSYGSPPAEGYAPAPAYYPGSAQEKVEVYAPRFRTEHTPLNAPAEKVSLSMPVSYADIDLRTGYGARELHRRVRDAAWQVCSSLREAYPFEGAHDTSCFKTAYENGIVSANQAIGATRVAYRQSYW